MSSIAPEKSLAGIADESDLVRLGRIIAANSETKRAVVGSKSSGMAKKSLPVKIDVTSITGDEKLRVRIGTRPSPLAIIQAEMIASKIPIETEIIPIRTLGDKNMNAFTSDPNGVKGMFTHEIEECLSAGEIDIAVHSLKDLAVNISPELPIVAYSKRGSPFDALVGNAGNVIGSSSLRRRLQAERLYPSCKVMAVRGNVGTRLRKLDEGEYDGLILSVAGLERLGMSQRITRIFSAEEIMPCSCQGIIACQGRIDEDYGYLSGVNDEISRDCAVAERSFSRCLGAGCNIPAGAYAEIDGETLTLKGLYIDDDGEFHRGKISGKRKDAYELGKKLAEELT